jgi:hypothetical protein
MGRQGASQGEGKDSQLTAPKGTGTLQGLARISKVRTTQIHGHGRDGDLLFPLAPHARSLAHVAARSLLDVLLSSLFSSASPPACCFLGLPKARSSPRLALFQLRSLVHFARQLVARHMTGPCSAACT